MPKAGLGICNVFSHKKHFRLLLKFAYFYSNDLQYSESEAVLIKSKMYLISYYIPLLILVLSLIKEYGRGIVLMTQNCDGVKVYLSVSSLSLLGNLV